MFCFFFGPFLGSRSAECLRFTSESRSLTLPPPPSLSKHLPSADTMAFNVDVDELENSHGATYVRKKAAKVTGENPAPKEQGYIQTSSFIFAWHQHLFSKKSTVLFYFWRFTDITANTSDSCIIRFLHL